MSIPSNLPAMHKGPYPTAPPLLDHGHMSNGASEHLKGKNARSTKAVNRPPIVEAVGWRRLDGKASVKDRDLAQKNSNGDLKKRILESLRIFGKQFQSDCDGESFCITCSSERICHRLQWRCFAWIVFQVKGEVSTAIFNYTALPEKGRLRRAKIPGFDASANNLDWGFRKIWLSTARARDTSEGC